jgi:hypothetical protein
VTMEVTFDSDMGSQPGYKQEVEVLLAKRSMK